MILLIDNYDSFTYNLYQYLGVFCEEIQVVRNDQITIEEIGQLKPDHIVLSPGPKSPREAGICVKAIQAFWRQIPILGICLGHQCIGEAFGGTVSYAKELYHGKQSEIYHNQEGLFQGLPSPVTAARYHSLAVLKQGLPVCFKVTAETKDGEIMAMEHKKFPVYGLQFHPESVVTKYGRSMMEHFLNCRSGWKR